MPCECVNAGLCFQWQSLTPQSPENQLWQASFSDNAQMHIAKPSKNQKEGLWYAARSPCKANAQTKLLLFNSMWALIS